MGRKRDAGELWPGKGMRGWDWAEDAGRGMMGWDCGREKDEGMGLGKGMQGGG